MSDLLTKVDLANGLDRMTLRLTIRLGFMIAIGIVTLILVHLS